MYFYNNPKAPFHQQDTTTPPTFMKAPRHQNHFDSSIESISSVGNGPNYILIESNIEEFIRGVYVREKISVGW